MIDRLEKAKLYYFIAIRDAILDLGDDFYDNDVAHQSILRSHPTLTHRPSLIMKSERLFRICLEDFIKAGWVDAIGDEFAPLYIRRKISLAEGPMSNAGFRQLYEKYEQLGDSRYAWFDSALIAVVDSFLVEELDAILSHTEGSDFGQGPSLLAPPAEDNWSPIPLDRADPQQATAIGSLEKVIEELRGDNGYATAHPEEKIFVQDKLSAVAKRLKEDAQISWMYLNEFALKPLGILITRFGPAAIGVSASVAKDTIVSFLKSKGLSFLDDLFK